MLWQLVLTQVAIAGFLGTTSLAPDAEVTPRSIGFADTSRLTA